RESKNKCWIQLSLDAEERKRPGPNAGYLTSTHEQWEVFFASQPGDEVQTSRRYFQIEIFAEPFLKLFDEEYASLSVEFAHPFHMAEEKSFGDETRQGSLINCRGVLVHDSAHLNQSIHELGRRDYKTEAKRWVKNLAHRAGINDPAGTIQTLKTRQRRPIETKL